MKTEASVQYLIDCDNTDQGCKDGWAGRAVKYVAKNGYVHTNYYPNQYLAVRRSCRGMYPQDYIKVNSLRSTSYLLVTPQRMKYYISNQPVMVAINAPACVRNYKNGTLSQNDCDCSHEDYLASDITTEMLVVGYGVYQPSDRESSYCDGYYILRTSWGVQFGE